MLNSRPPTQPAFSLIEIMVAAALVSLILTALSINMVYTQRTIKNAQLRAKAVDQANSCMNAFRNLRDSLAWNEFCKRLIKCAQDNGHNYTGSGITGSITNKPQLDCGYDYQYPTRDVRGNLTGGIKSNEITINSFNTSQVDYLYNPLYGLCTTPHDGNHPPVRCDPTHNTNTPYQGTAVLCPEVKFEGDNAQYTDAKYWLEITGCKSNDPAGKATVTIYVDYKDYNGNPVMNDSSPSKPTVMVSQTFELNSSTEAPYIHY